MRKIVTTNLKMPLGLDRFRPVQLFICVSTGCVENGCLNGRKIGPRFECFALKNTKFGLFFWVKRLAIPLWWSSTVGGKKSSNL